MEHSSTDNTPVNEDLSPLIKGESSSTSGSTSLRRHLPGKQAKIHVTLCILITELCERLTFYGITANLVPFCSDVLGLTSPLPSTVNLLFQGTCYFLPVFGGWIADSYLGRFNSIFGSALLYFVGTLLLSAVSFDKSYATEFGKNQHLNNPQKIAFFIVALVFLAFGTGGIKANVSPFGADQVRNEGPRAIQRFFNWFYWFINIGSFISFTLVVWVQQKYGFFQGYIITAISMFLGVLTFVIGRNSYIVKPTGGSTLGNTFKVITSAVKNKSSLRIKGGSWLDKAKVSLGGRFSNTQVDDVKSLLRIIPVFSMFIVYWTLYSQMQTTYLIQAQYMQIHFGFNLPVASLSIFDIASVLILIPFMDKVVYPLLRYIGFHFTPLRRIGVGMVFAASSVAVAGWVEIERRKTWQSGKNHIQPLFNKNYNASDLPIFYQIPQFLLIGTSEVFTSITGLEFAYSQAPRCLQGLIMGIFLITSGLGNYLSSALANIVHHFHPSWYPKNPNEGYMEYYFFLLAGLMLANLLVFIFVAMNYKYVDNRRIRTASRIDRDSASSTTASQSAEA